MNNIKKNTELRREKHKFNSIPISRQVDNREFLSPAVTKPTSATKPICTEVIFSTSRDSLQKCKTRNRTINKLDL